MALSRENYETLVAKLEVYAKANPAQYRLRVKLLALLGQVYIMGVGLISLGFTLGVGYAMITGHLSAVAVKLELALAVFTFAIVSALWVRIPPPEGIPLLPGQAPRLFAMLEDLRDKLDCAPLFAVLVTPEFNASAAQYPRYGIFGGYRNVVTVGLPMLQALSPEGLKAVLAHELGHLSGNHSRFAGKTYRVRAAWSRLTENFKAKGGLTELIFGKFFNLYAPYFSAYTFVLARQDEYEADRCAAELTSPQVMTDALIRTDLAAQFLDEEYWKDVYERADFIPKPDAAPFSAIGSALREQMKPTDCERWLDRALRQRTDTGDTHPSLMDRLAALGTLEGRDRNSFDPPVRPSLPSAPSVSAAQYYFGDALNPLIARLDEEWQCGVSPVWEARHQMAEEGRKRLAGLEHRARYGEILPEAERWERVSLVQEFRSNAEAIPLLREMLAEKPEAAPRLYALGMALLEEKDDSGIELIERAMHHDSRSAFSGCDAICGHLMEANRPQEAETYRRRALKQYDLELEAQEETEVVRAKDRFAAPELPQEERQTLTLALREHPKVKEAYLFRKVLKTFPERPFYVVAWVPKKVWFHFSRDGEFTQENAELATSIPVSESCVFVVLDASLRKLAKKIKAVPGAKIL